MFIIPENAIWVLIPIVAILAGVIKHSMRLKEKRLDRAQEHETEMTRRHAAETRQLAERVQVLERIVTDKGLDVSIEIEKLRDQPNVRDMRAD